MLIALSGMEWQKFVVPSMGSTTHSQSVSPSNAASSASSDAAAPPPTLSSPRKSWSGKVARTRASMTACTSGSTSVSRSRAFALVCTTSAPSFSSMMAAPSFAASVATFRHIWRIAGRSLGSSGSTASWPIGSGLDPSARGVGDTRRVAARRGRARACAGNPARAAGKDMARARPGV